MNPHRRFVTYVILFAALGMLLSGYLTYRWYFSTGCQQGPLAALVSCGTGPKVPLIFGQPTCVYGFGMFALVVLIAFMAFSAKRYAAAMKTILGVAVIGTLFSGGLSIYELFILKLEFTTLPACVYGLVFYLGVLITSIMAVRQLRDTPPPATLPTAPTM